jgi:hypothetical protein
MKSFLAVIVNYGTEQLDYLQQVINELKSFEKYKVTVVVHSNINLGEIDFVDHLNVIELENYQLLPMTCRQTINQESDNFDYFIFSENDHLWKEHHIDKYIEYSKILPENRIPGLIQYEEDHTGKYYPAYHAHYDWDYTSVEEYGGKKFAHFTNVHQASFIISKEVLNKIKETRDFNQFFGQDQYSLKCKTNTDIYLHSGMKKVICISEFYDNLIQHLPNVYINGADGYVHDDGSIGRRAKQRSDDNRMQQALNRML